MENVNSYLPVAGVVAVFGAIMAMYFWISNHINDRKEHIDPVDTTKKLGAIFDKLDTKVSDTICHERGASVREVIDNHSKQAGERHKGIVDRLVKIERLIINGGKK